MAGLNSLMLGAVGGAASAPGPTSGIVPYMNRIGGAVPGQGAAIFGGSLLQQLLTKKKKQLQAGVAPATSATAADGSTTPASPADVGRGLASKPARKAAYIGY